VVEWVRADAAVPPAVAPAVARAPDGPAIGTAGPPRLSITMPEHNARIWRNPEMPPALDRLALKAAAAPGVSQVVWYVDGLPFRTARPDETVYWPLTPGAHRFQLRLPLQDGESRPVRIVVE
jgi:penicillin-binding protein 1C